MKFTHYPGHERGCGHCNDCPHAGGASIGRLILLNNNSADTIDQLRRVVDAERKISSELVAETTRLEYELAQVKLELRLERQNKFATNEQKEAEPTGVDDNSQDTPATVKTKKRGAPVGHAGWFRPTPTQYDLMVEVAAPRRCPHCSGSITVDHSQPVIDHLQEDIIDNTYRVVCYQHPAACCDECGRWVQQAGQGELLGSRIGPYLRSQAVWLRNAIGISYRKIPRIFEEMHGISFTPAALIGFETMLAEKAEPVVDDIAKKLASTEGAVHADETYWTTDGARSYFWVHGDLNYIHFQYDTSRAGQVSRDILGNDFVGTLVTDCYSGYSASSASAKQKCLVHLARTARDWQKLTEPNSDDFQFFEDVRRFVTRSCALHRKRAAGQLTARGQAREKAWLRSEQSRLETILLTHKKAVTLQARLLNHTDQWLVFLDDPRVPPTNNLAERALRPLVIMRKITFGHRSDAGAERMAKLMTVGETARRHGHRASDIYFELFTRPPDRVMRKLYAGG